MATAIEVVWLGHDNSIDLILKADGVAVDLTPVTKITLTVGDVLVSSTNQGTDAIRWNQGGYATGEIRMMLGDESLVEGPHDAPLIVYDASNTEGVVWGILRLTVYAEVEATP